MLIKGSGEQIGEDLQGAASRLVNKPDGSLKQSAPNTGPNRGGLDEQQRQVEPARRFGRFNSGNTQDAA